MIRPTRRVFSDDEARTAQALLSAAEEDGLLTVSQATLWREISARAAVGELDPTARAEVCTLMRAVGQGAARDHWTGKRWRQIDGQAR